MAIKKIQIHPSSLCLILLPFFGILSLWQTAILWGSAALHETGHLFALRLCGCPVKALHVLPFGLCAIPDEGHSLSPKDEIFCATAGPAINLLLCAILLALPLSARWEAPRYALYCNISLFAVNILPILPLDGGRILYFSVLKKKNPATSESVCKAVAILLLLLLSIPSVLSLLCDQNPSLLMIWAYLTWYTRTRRGSI